MRYRAAKIHPVNMDLSVNKWFVYYSFMHPLTGKFERFKVYEDINLHTGDDKIQYAKDLRDAVNETLKKGYSPYDEGIKQQQIIAELKHRAEQETAEDLGNYSMPRALNLFLKAKQKAGKSPATMNAYNTVADIVKNWLNDNALLLAPARSLTGKQLLDMLQREADKRKWENKTYNSKLLYLETILNWLAMPLNGQIIPHNPIKGAEQRTVLQNKPSAYTDEELDAILSEVRRVKDVYMEGIILTCYYAAVRSKAEMRGLKGSNILFDRDLLLLSADATKARREDNIPLDPFLKRFYLQQGFDKLPKDWYIFGKGGAPGPHRATANYYSERYRPYREKFNIPEEKKLYNWKHTRAVHLGKLKVDIYAIKQLFRHKSIEETENYMRDLGIVIDRAAVQNSREL
jgi:site-specific recombinase XerD